LHESCRFLRSGKYSRRLKTPRHFCRANLIPLAPEFVTPHGGAEKQDCEINAARRWLAELQLKLSILNQALVALCPARRGWGKLSRFINSAFGNSNE